VRRTLAVGDHVEWNSEAGRLADDQETIGSEIKFKGYTMRATKQEPVSDQ
jgi:hypothetical protein